MMFKWQRVPMLILLLSLTASAFGEERQAVILMYHHFGVDQYPSTNVRLAQFDAHLDHLAEAGYAVWPLEKVVDYLRRGEAFPGRVVAITVDDAYDSVYEQAFPRLVKRGWPFTVFVATDGVDQKIPAYMNWEQMREMQQQGVSFANHSASHDYLIRRQAGENEAQWHARVKADIERAARRLKEELGSLPLVFAYPYGEYNSALADMVAELGYVAFGQQSGPAGLGDDLRALPRYPMAEAYAELNDFKTKVASLAFPITHIEPWDPVISQDHAPAMRLRFAETAARLQEMTCYYSAKGRMEITWLDRDDRKVEINPHADLPKGRSRYNCTAPSDQRGRFYWFSHVWIRQ